MKQKKTRKDKPSGEPSRPVVTEPAREEPQAQTDDVPVVAIGASAGGLEAVNDLLSHLPADTGMGFVLVQHLDPKHESMLAELISRSTRMPVLEVQDGMCVQANHVYVIPPNATMTIRDHILHLSEREVRAQHMSVDSFMRSLAEAHGNNSIGMVLSGAGSDGALGLAEIQAQGGVTFAQDETTKYDGMPRSAIALGCVDFVLPPADIARELARIAHHPYVAPRKAAAAVLVPDQVSSLKTIFQLIRKSTGVDFTHYRQTTIRRRIQRRMIVHKIDSLPRYARYVQQNPAELKALFQDMLINVTSFFRNSSVFDALKSHVFPAILKHRSESQSIRVWVPGCSSGEEAYSVAITLLEFLSDRGASVPLQIFGSDVSESSIEKARAGVYPENIQGDIPPERLRRFFQKVEGGYRINKNVRDICIFAQHNLFVDPPFSKMDLISCRNLLIYLEAPLQKEAVTLFHYALKPHGFLLLGNNESVGTLGNLFAQDDRIHKIYSKRATVIRQPMDFASRQIDTRESGTGPGRRPRAFSREEPSWNAAEAQKEFDRRLLQQYAPAAVFVDEALEIVHSRGDVDRYLKIPSGRATLSILKMAREGLLLELRNAVARAKKDNVTVRREHVEIKADHTVRDINIEVIPMRVSNSHEPYLMIVFEEAGNQRAQRPARHGAVIMRKESSSKRFLKLQQELAATTEYLHTVIENQEATNEELQSANEEILSSNEELQSTNEELETAKEELQSANEELTTVNDELRNRNKEILQSNNDLNNLLASIDVAIVILGSDLAIRRFTPEAQKILGLIPSDVGRPFENINTGLDMPDLQEVVHGVISDFIPVERTVIARSGKPYLLRVTPYRSGENKVEGVVLTMTLAMTLVEQRAAALSAEHASEIMLLLDSELKIRVATPSFYRTFRLNPESVRDQPLDRLDHVLAGLPELQTALYKAQRGSAAIDPFTFELKVDGNAPRKFECKLERIALPGGASAIAISLHPPPAGAASSPAKA